MITEEWAEPPSLTESCLWVIPACRKQTKILRISIFHKWLIKLWEAGPYFHTMNKVISRWYVPAGGSCPFQRASPQVVEPQAGADTSACCGVHLEGVDLALAGWGLILRQQVLGEVATSPGKAALLGYSYTKQQTHLQSESRLWGY